jgi:hypothetical protein
LLTQLLNFQGSKSALGSNDHSQLVNLATEAADWSIGSWIKQ